MSISAHATNYPEEWVKYYQDNNLQYTDPVVIAALNRLTPFAWDEKIITGNKLFFSGLFEKAKSHDIISGYTFVLHDFYHNLATLTLLAPPGNKAMLEKCIELNMGSINLLLASAHEQYLAFKALSGKEGAATANSSMFTTREKEVIYWISLGKTYPETAIILGIKATTVKFHMANIIKKSGATNARHAISRCKELKLIKAGC